MNFSAIRDFVCRLATVAAVVATAVSCSEYEFGGSAGTGERLSGEVILAIPELSVPRVGTRVAIDTDEETGQGNTVSLKWTENDAFALWVSRTDGEPVGDGHKNMKFSYHGDSKYSEGKVYFASYKVPEMSAGEYSYTAFYPCQDDEKKVDRANNRVTYTIPSEQSGLYNGSCDIMSAAADFSDALVLNSSQDINLTFKHHTHALKITVPAEKNSFGQADITRIRIEFSKPVAGDLTFDTVTTDPDLSGITENYIDVRFTEEHPFKAGEPFWVFIAPVDMSDGTVKFTAFGGDDEKYQSEPSVSGAFPNLTKGVITPVTLGIGEAFSVTWFEYTIEDWSRLGEEIESLNITLPEGISLADRSEDENRSKKIERDSEGKYRFAFRTDELAAAAANGVNIVAQFESEHAIVSPYASDAGKFVITADGYTPDATNSRTIEHVPYLLEEDFEGVSFSNNDKTSTTTERGKDSSTAFNGNLSGEWHGARCGANGSIVRIMNHTEVVTWATGDYRGRIDSPTLSRLKSDTEAVTISIDFDFSMGRNLDRGSIGLISHYFSIGVSNTTSYDSSNGTGPIMNNNIDYDITIPVDQFVEEWAGVNNHKSYTTECVNSDHIVWSVYVNNSLSGSITANTMQSYWLYLDNIKVSIVNENQESKNE